MLVRLFVLKHSRNNNKPTTSTIHSLWNSITIQIRRQDRLLSEARAYEILKEGEYGVLSMRTEDGEGAYGIPLSYVWDRGNSIYIHCAPVGRKLNCIDACTNVSFCIVGRTKVIPGEFTTAYESIVLRCTAHHSLHEAERMSALSLF